MDKRTEIDIIIHDAIYTNARYPHVGNNYILASNRILDKFSINDIDIICEFAKFLQENITYDHELSKEDLDKILIKLSKLLNEYYNKPFEI